MRLSTIEYNGYKRLNQASCNVDGPAIAFIGPNESGKSSLLQGLQWLTGPDGVALSVVEQNRRERPGVDQLVVSALYRIDDDDLAALDDLAIDAVPAITRDSVTQFRFSRRADGTPVTGLKTTVQRNTRPFERALRSVKSAQNAFAQVEPIVEDQGVDDIGELLADAAGNLDPADTSWNEARLDRLSAGRSLLMARSAQLGELELPSAKMAKLLLRLNLASEGMGSAIEAGELDDPELAIRNELIKRRPRFILFGDGDRDLEMSYFLADENLRNAPPAPLTNLLRVGRTSLSELWDAISLGDPASTRTLQRRINATLSERLQPMWTQSKLTISLAINQGGLVEVNIEELDSPEFTVTPIKERSDGLRTFLGLVCFLIAAELDIPPVLLIDEAERNLHYDAQADLVRVLTRELRVHKVIYTTHSPGCLPQDIGTGIRVVVRDPNDKAVSKLENNFWTQSDPGFSRLLFAMGAEAAAFSAFRRAVLAEGASEMILLPTLLRNATAGAELDFQVAFGLSNMSAPKAIGSVSLITTFLVDGDEAGDIKKGQLLESGVPSSHIFQLPKGKAIEDLVEPSTYLRVVNEFLAEKGHPPIPSKGLSKNVTIARAIDDYCKSNYGVKSGVSHKIIAARLAEFGDKLPMTARSKRYVAGLREGLEKAFVNPYAIAGDTD